MDRELATWSPDASFTATTLAAEIQRRYGAVAPGRRLRAAAKVR